MKILLAEDDRMISDIYQKKFEVSGDEVMVATGGKEVLKKIKEEKFDLILLDLVFPEVGGMELLKTIKKEKYSDAKIVIFSNLNERENVEEANRLGADGFIHKSQFTPAETLEEIKKIMQQ